MEFYSVTFAGHREIFRFEEIDEKLDEIISALLRNKDFVEFYVGDNGDFDRMATSAIRRARRQYGTQNSAINLVLPYKKANIDLMESQFDSVIIPSELHGVHPKKAITERNRWIVDRSDLLICYVEKSGGAATTMKYAKEVAQIEILNLCNKKETFV